MRGSPGDAVNYFLDGARLIVKPGFRRFILIPLLINVIIFIGATIALFIAFQDVFDWVHSWMPSWLSFLTWILWPILGLLLLVVYGYSFNLITNFIAAPFFGLLAEKIETQITGVAPPDESWGELIPRTLLRESIKLWYFITRGLLVFLIFVVLFFIPGVNFIGAAIGVVWGCWCMAVQYLDYPADNHKLEFPELRRRLNQQPLTSYSYGGIVLLGSMVPIINIFVTPIAVAGATLYWINDISRLKNT